MNLPRFRTLDVPALVRQELARLTSTKLGTLALIALMCVPLLYGGLYLWANRDPQGSLDHLAVAIVVEDAGTTKSDGTALNHGQDIADELIRDRSFDWEQVTADAARLGVENGAYGFAVILPPEFSADLESAAGDDPRQARIELRTNDANNAIATQTGQRAMEKLRATIAENIGNTASLRLLDGLATVRDGLDQAQDGAGQLRDGETQAISGVDQLSSGATQLHDGAAQLADGAAQAHDGASQLADGASQLSSGAQSAASGASQLSSGLATLDDKASALPDATSRLADGARQVADGNAEIAAAANQVGTTAQTLANDLPAIRADLKSRLEAQGLTPAQVQQAMDALAPLDTKLSTANTDIQAKVSDINRLADGANQVADGAAQLAASAPALVDGIGQAADGASQLADGTQQLATGASQLEDGAVQLRDGTGQLADGASQLVDGTSQLSDGLMTLRTGLVQLQDGASQLQSKLAEGRDGIPASTQQLRTGQADTIADPVRVDEISTAKAENYGAGLAPFFATLAAWIGMYALFLIVKPFSRRAATAMWSPLRVTLAGWATPAVLGALQMAMLSAILTKVVGFHFVHPWATFGLLVLASMTFASIIQALNVWLGSVGQFMGLILMVLQLVTAGGTFPWQTLPAPLDAIHHVLPMSWSVTALRQAMLGGDLGLAVGMATLLVTLLAGCLAASAVGVARVTSTQVMRDIAPSIIG